MSQFLDLPRELRDMIYMAILTWEDPRPTLQDLSSRTDERRRQGGTLAHQLVHGCDFPSKVAPRTCANFLAMNRQVYSEMMQAIEYARKKDMLFAKIDCVKKDWSTCYFTWLSFPLVHTTSSASATAPVSWAPEFPVIGRLLGAPHGRRQRHKPLTSTLEKLQMDVRILYDETSEQRRARGTSDRTCWAICEALRRVFELDTYQADTRTHGMSDLAIDTLIINVIPPDQPAKDTLPRRDSANETDSETTSEDEDHSRVLARDLVDVWNKLWAGDDYKGRFYCHLLERIKRVRVCVDGELVRERELRLELERGQEERRRIAMRVGW